LTLTQFSDLLLHLGLMNILGVLVFHKELMKDDFAALIFVNLETILLWSLS